MFIPASVSGSSYMSWHKGCLNNNIERGNCTHKLRSEGYEQLWRSENMQGLVLLGEFLVTPSAGVTS